MKKIWLAVAVFLTFFGSVTLQGAEPAEEQQLIGVLESGASLQQKDAACVGLKRVGTAQSIPALAALLTDEDLSHSTRYALESMPTPEAGAALMAALNKTTGLLRVGIIQSLGQRREVQALEPLTKLLADPDPNVVAATASSLGRIGGSGALDALQAALPQTRNTTARAAMLEGLLRIADQELHELAQPGQAFKLYTQIYESMAGDHFRVAAYCGMIRSAENRAMALVLKGIQDGDGPTQMAALRMAHEIQDPAMSQACVDLLPKAQPGIQIALIEMLRQNGDAASASAVIELVGSRDEGVRMAAIQALADLGDDTAAACLLEVACSSKDLEKKAARQSLLDLRRGQVSDALLHQMASDNPAFQAEAVRALIGRGEDDAVSGLIELARLDNPEPTRKAAFQALAQLAGAQQVAPLVRLVLDAKDESARNPAADALSSICRRLQDRGERFDTEPLVNGLNDGNTEARVALFEAASALPDERVRTALRDAASSSDPVLCEAAVRAMAEAHDPELMPDLLALSGQALAPNLRVMVIRGYLRLAAVPDSVTQTPALRVGAFEQILPLMQSASEKWLVLASLSNIHEPEALKPALALLDDPDTRAEAAQAVVQIANGINATHPDDAREALRAVLADSPEASQREAAEAGIRQLDGLVGFITAWQVAGPYNQDGKDCSMLFDVVFPPENPEAGDVVWNSLPAGANPAQPFLMDMLKCLGGDQRVGYARTRIHSEKAQSAILEMGTDDGVKAWLNGEKVYAQNYIGPMVVGSEKAEVALKEGWNMLMLKVTQNSMGWEFCVRLANPDSSAIQGIKIDPAFGEGESAAPLPTAAEAMSIDKSTPVQFYHAQLDPLFRSEGVAVADFNNDGKMDVATGNLLYLGPDWKTLPMQATEKQYPPEGYSQEFYCFAEDLNNDGWMDLIVVGFPGAQTRWMENPGQAGGAWVEHPAIEKTGNESPDWIDVDKDGKKELVFVADQGTAFARPGEDPAQMWPITVIAGPDDPRLGHGLGVGDLNGDGRNDILCPEGWWEAPASAEEKPWAYHKVKLGYEAPAQMCVYDVDGDGDADVLSSGAHRYGLWWYEQTPEGWTPNEIDHDISQMHVLHLADMNGDGLLDIVTGKRFWAHREGDEGIDDPAVLCWYELQREGGKPVWKRHIIDTDSGVGLHVAIADVDGDGQPDIVTSSKKGVYVFTQERQN